MTSKYPILPTSTSAFRLPFQVPPPFPLEDKQLSTRLNSRLYKNEPRVPVQEGELYQMFTDGGSRGNPGVSGCGFVIYSQSMEVVFKGSARLPDCTNNQAEYMGLLYGLKQATNLRIKNLHCFMDSLLIVQQCAGKFQVKDRKLAKLREEVRKEIAKLDEFQIRHVLRDQNRVADALANEAMDFKSSTDLLVPSLTL